MAKSKTERKPLSLSPEGELRFGAITKPSTKFNDDGRYSAMLAFDPKSKDFLAMKAALDAELESFIAANPDTSDYDRQVPYSDEVDKTTKKPTGKVVINFGNNAVGKNNKTGETFNVTIPIFDSKAKPAVNPPIGRGSILRVAFSMFGYTVPGQPKRNIPPAVGVGVRLKQVQIIKLVPYTGGGEPAFGEVETADGYVADTAGAGNETFSVEPDQGNQEDGAGVIGGKKGNF